MAKDGLRFLEEDSPVNCTCDILNKGASTFNYVQYMLDRTNRMFRYTGLPDTIPDYLLEYMLQVYSSVVFAEHSGDLYAFRARAGGPPDPYYRRTVAVVANPGLNMSQNYAIVNHLPPFDRTQWDSLPPCVLGLNDTQEQGLIPLFTRYAVQMTENDISIRSAQINLRSTTTITADNGPEIESAKQYMKDIEAGKLSVIGKRPFLDGVTITNNSSGASNVIIQLIELQQYLKASWYNEIGLNSNFNMKREYMSSEEINSSADIMLPLVDNMLSCRQRFVEAANKQFGTNITVEKDSAWEKKQLESDINPETGEPMTEDSGPGEEEELNGEDAS